jgi:hypothetical protein
MSGATWSKAMVQERTIGNFWQGADLFFIRTALDSNSPRFLAQFKRR